LVIPEASPTPFSFLGGSTELLDFRPVKLLSSPRCTFKSRHAAGIDLNTMNNER